MAHCVGRKKCPTKWREPSRAERKKQDRCHNRATAVAVGAERRATRKATSKAGGRAFNATYNKHFKACMAGRSKKKR